MRADARAKRDQIIDAALAQFRTLPSSKITLEGIAQDADVGIATLYRHFPSRAVLLDVCATVYIDRLDALLARTLDAFDSDPAGEYERFVWALVESGVGVLAPALAPESEGKVNPTVLERRDAFFANVQELLDRAAAHGLVAPGQTPIELAAELIVATRPIASPIGVLFPDVRDRLVRHLMVGWREAV